MQHRNIGSLSVSVIGLGCNNFGGRLDAAQTNEVVSAALDSGINLLDTADIYGSTLSEEYLGQALKDRRERAVVATKFGMKVDDERQGAGHDECLHGSLRVYQAHLSTLFTLSSPRSQRPLSLPAPP